MENMVYVNSLKWGEDLQGHWVRTRARSFNNPSPPLEPLLRKMPAIYPLVCHKAREKSVRIFFFFEHTELSYNKICREVFQFESVLDLVAYLEGLLHQSQN
jgi:hypothetical protein